MRILKIFKISIIVLCFFIYGCTTPVNEPDDNLDVPKDSILDDICIEYTIYEDEYITLDETKDNEELNYSCSNTDIVLLEKNKVSGIKAGKATIKVTCNDEEKIINVIVLAKIKLVVPQTEYTIKQKEKFNIEASLENGEGTITFVTDSNKINLENNQVEGIAVGDAVVIVSYDDTTINITIHVLSNISFEVENIMEIYVEEKKDLGINVISGDIKDIVVTTTSNIVEIVDNVYVYGISEGTCDVNIILNDQTEIVQVTVKDLDVEILNDDISIDYFETATLDILYPTHTDAQLQYVIFKENIIEIVDNQIIPLNCGETKVRVQLGDNKYISDTIKITITVNPLELIENANIPEVLMRKKVTTYGNSEKNQSVMGGVSYYYYGNLNLTYDILDIYDNDYVGQIATPEILAIAEELHLPRTGIKLEEIKYITYHDTGNNEAGASAKNNISYMKSSDSISYRARSWHYTVDDSGVIQTIPDDEVTWQGDTYGAYATSIGIETCVNNGSKLNITWQRMGKLCGMLMAKYNLDMTCIKQHYDWNQKECPQTLRKNNLYSYALKMIETEWLIKKLLYDYTITFESLSPEYLDNTGQIILEPAMPITVSYRVTVTNSKTGYNESIELKSLCNPLS